MEKLRGNWGLLRGKISADSCSKKWVGEPLKIQVWDGHILNLACACALLGGNSNAAPAQREKNYLTYIEEGEKFPWFRPILPRAEGKRRRKEKRQ